MKIVAVDFDGTLCKDKYPKIGKPNLNLIKNLVYQRKLNNIKIILWTCRTDQLLMDAVKWCSKYSLTFDAINENLPETLEEYHYRDSRKITYDILIDDRNISVDSYLDSNGMFKDANKPKIWSDKQYVIQLPNLMSDNGRQYLVKDNKGKVFACALSTAKKYKLRKIFSFRELELLPKVYQELASEYVCKGED